jgi:hypothetical protein
VSRRIAALCALAAALASGGTAWAHEQAPEAGFRSTVSGIEPRIPGLRVDVLDSGTLTVRNWSGKDVVVDGHDGEPLYRFDGRAVYRRAGRGWTMLERGTSYGWHDPRVHWGGPVPERSGRVGEFRIGGNAGDVPFTISGFIGYRAPASSETEGRPSSWPAIAVAGGAFLLAALVLPRVRRREGEGRSEDAVTEPEPGRLRRRR